MNQADTAEKVTILLGNGTSQDSGNKLGRDCLLVLLIIWTNILVCFDQPLLARNYGKSRVFGMTLANRLPR